MSDTPMERIQNRMNSDLRRQFRSFEGLVKKPQKSQSTSTLKWFSLYSIAVIACLWAVTLDGTELEPWIGATITLGVSAVIVMPILFVENARAASEGRSRVRRYMNALVFVGLTAAVGFAGWIGGTAAVKFVESLKG